MKYDSTVPPALRHREKYTGPGTGMPTSLYLDQFGSHVYDVFDDFPYLVGSALRGKKWRDVDVRLILADEEYEEWGFGDPRYTHRNEKWVAMVLAFSALGKHMTGLPIDFQIQQRSYANELYPFYRSALGIVPWRFK